MSRRGGRSGAANAPDRDAVIMGESAEPAPAISRSGSGQFAGSDALSGAAAEPIFRTEPAVVSSRDSLGSDAGQYFRRTAPSPWGLPSAPVLARRLEEALLPATPVVVADGGSAGPFSAEPKPPNMAELHSTVQKEAAASGSPTASLAVALALMALVPLLPSLTFLAAGRPAASFGAFLLVASAAAAIVRVPAARRVAVRWIVWALVTAYVVFLDLADLVEWCFGAKPP